MKIKIALIAGFALAASAKTHHASTSGKGGTTDQAFVTMAAETDMTEANLGQLAQERAGSQSVKDYAQMLVTDHTADYSKISDVAAKAGLTVPKGLDAQHNKMIAPLRKLKGAAFDRQYLHMMVAGHEAALAAYNKKSRDAKNADVKAYAQATIPTLQKHEQGAKDLVKAKK
jgi:putative membrane protein